MRHLRIWCLMSCGLRKQNGNTHATLKPYFPLKALNCCDGFTTYTSLVGTQLHRECCVNSRWNTPALFCPMQIETVHSPAKLVFSTPCTGRPLSQVLRRVVGDREEELSNRLATVWNVSNPEVRACHLRPAVHAEMQLIGFYDHNPELTSSFRLIGVSKESFYLCQRFLMGHASSFTVSSCQQELYLSWRPPPSAKAKTYKWTNQEPK
jgi:hypothetical protein